MIRVFIMRPYSVNSDKVDDGKSSVTVKMVESDDAAYKHELARLFSSRRLLIQLMQTILTANMQMVLTNYNTMSRPAMLSSICYVIDIAVQYPPSNSRMLARVYYRTCVPESLFIC